ncbi:MAG: histidinol-phosphatase [Tranquillimonas sp.]
MPATDTVLLHDLTTTALALADAARGETLRHFRKADLVARDKGVAAFDPVTEADRAAETAMRALLARHRPDDGILGEEFGSSGGTTGLTWVIDPVDGTRAFLAGAPTWGVLVAVSDAEGPILGLVDQPFISERFFGGPDGAWTEGPAGRHPLRTRPPRPLSQAILMSTFPEIGTEAEARAFRAVADRVRLTRYGMDCYAYMLVALGQVDLVIEAGLNPYDIQGPMAVIRAAGGVVTDWRGGPAQAGGRVIAAANPEIHAQALALLADTP